MAVVMAGVALGSVLVTSCSSSGKTVDVGSSASATTIDVTSTSRASAELAPVRSITKPPCARTSIPGTDPDSHVAACFTLDRPLATTGDFATKYVQCIRNDAPPWQVVFRLRPSAGQRIASWTTTHETGGSQIARLAVVESNRVVAAPTIFTPLTSDIALAEPNEVVVRQIADALPGESIAAPPSRLTCP
jgi:hypothetical protein